MCWAVEGSGNAQSFSFLLSCYTVRFTWDGFNRHKYLLCFLIFHLLPVPRIRHRSWCLPRMFSPYSLLSPYLVLFSLFWRWGQSAQWRRDTNATPRVRKEWDPSSVEHRLPKEFEFNSLSIKISSGQSEDLRCESPVVSCLAARLGMPGDFLRKAYDCQVLGTYKPQLPQGESRRMHFGNENYHGFTVCGTHLSKAVPIQRRNHFCLWYKSTLGSS